MTLLLLHAAVTAAVLVKAGWDRKRLNTLTVCVAVCVAVCDCACVCVSPADLSASPPTGTDTVGSSEAVLLGGLAMKRRWQDRRKAAGLDASKPNIVMGTETHVVRGAVLCAALCTVLCRVMCTFPPLSAAAAHAHATAVSGPWIP